MAKFSISSEIDLGFHCDGCGEYTQGEGSVTLTDRQISDLVRLIRENDGETDVIKLNLEEKYPDIYEALDDAFHEMAYAAEYRYWILNGYDNGYYEEPDGFVERFEKEGLFKYEPDLDALREELDLDEDDEIDEYELEDAKRETFDEWLDEYVNAMSDDEKVSFIENYYGDVVDMESGVSGYAVEIPDEIVKMANEEK